MRKIIGFFWTLKRVIIEVGNDIMELGDNEPSHIILCDKRRK